jgi:hypothetical protein
VRTLVSKSQAEEIAALLARTKIRLRGGGGALVSEPVVVVRGKHRSHFDLFNCWGSSLGRVVQVGRTDAYEVRDVYERRVLNLQEVGSSWRALGLTKWRYELSIPDEPEAIRVSRVRRLTDTASITQGPTQIGLIRSSAPTLSGALRRAFGSPGRKKSRVFAVEYQTGSDVASVYIARKRQRHEHVDLVVEITDGTSEQLRKIALAASVIADLELINLQGSDRPGPPAGG